MPLRRGPVLPYSVVAGATPWARRWVVASAKLTGSVFAPEPPKVYETFREILDEHPSFATIVAFAPIGYARNVETGFRQCDVDAKALLGRRSITVHRVPTRATLIDGHDVKQDCLDAVTISKLLAMTDVALEMSPYRQRVVYEGHPELSFFGLNGDVPLQHSKVKVVGRDERREVLLAKVRGIEKVTDSDAAPTKHLLDAAALLFSARRVFLHAAKRVPAEAQWDEDGLRMEIVF